MNRVEDVNERSEQGREQRAYEFIICSVVVCTLSSGLLVVERTAHFGLNCVVRPIR